MSLIDIIKESKKTMYRLLWKEKQSNYLFARK